MLRLVCSLPRYRCHRARGQAIHSLDGRVFYLGPHNKKASRVEYGRLTAEWLVNGRRLAARGLSAPSPTILERVAAYWSHCRRCYRKGGQTTGSIPGIRVALRHIRQWSGRMPASEFGPIALQVVRQRLVDLG